MQTKFVGVRSVAIGAGAGRADGERDRERPPNPEASPSPRVVHPLYTFAKLKAALTLLL